MREEVGELHGATGVKPKTRKRLPRLMVSGFLSGVFGWVPEIRSVVNKRVSFVLRHKTCQ